VVDDGDRATATACLVRGDRGNWFQLDSLRRHLREHFESLHLLQLEPVHGEDGQAHIAASLARVRPEIAVRAASFLAGILELTPWLTPVSSRPAAATGPSGSP
jgi:hypothetical protein